MKGELLSSLQTGFNHSHTRGGEEGSRGCSNGRSYGENFTMSVKKKKCNIYILGIGPDPYRKKAFGWKFLSSVMGQVPSQCHSAALSALKAALQAHFTWRMPTLTPVQAHQQRSPRCCRLGRGRSQEGLSLEVSWLSQQGGSAEAGSGRWVTGFEPHPDGARVAGTLRM